MFISWIVIFAYACSFAHDVIPHFHENDKAYSMSHQHHMARCDSGVKHSHISHGAHLDNGLFDYLVCIFGETDHPVSDVGLYLGSEEPTTFYVPFLVTTLQEQAIIRSVVITTNWQFKDRGLLRYTSPLISCDLYRGPPVF